MMDWFNGLQTRERYLLGIVGAVTILALLYTLVWDPVSSGASRLAKSVATQKNHILWMSNASTEIGTLQGAGGNSRAAKGNVSLITAVETSAKRSGIRKAVTRMEPQGATKITVELKKADFDRLISWIALLSREYGAVVSQFSAGKSDVGGLVDARLIVTRDS